jgi:hypothetical protein
MRTIKFDPSRVAGSALVLLLATPGLADAPEGHFKVVGGTVEDAATKLTWQRSVTEGNYDHLEAAAYCAALKLSGTGWRLPTIKELHTLVDETRTMPAIDRSAFPDAPSAYFWTSSRVANFAIYAWTVNFADGTDLWFPTGNQERVRCVR